MPIRVHEAFEIAPIPCRHLIIEHFAQFLRRLLRKPSGGEQQNGDDESFQHAGQYSLNDSHLKSRASTRRKPAL